MTKVRKRLLIVFESIFGAIAVTAIVLVGVWMGCYELQKSVIRMMCTNSPSSIPDDYENICAATTLETHVYDGKNELDVIEPNGEIAMPVFVIFHGGYYAGGGRGNQEPYARLIASKGFRVVNVDYSLTPENVYPTQLNDANAALNFVAQLFPEATFVLSGDSAGAHLAAQLTAAVRTSQLNDRLQAETVARERVAGFVGNCGFYDASTAESTGFFLVKSALQMLLGDRDYKNNPLLSELDISRYAESFPPSLLVCGDKDPFLSQAESLALALTAANVRTLTYFPTTQKDQLAHEFQCNFNLPESYTAVDNIVAFLQSL